MHACNIYIFTDLSPQLAGGEVKLGELTRDEEPPETDFARNNYGVSCFFLTDYLKPNVRNLKLISPVIPVKRYQDLESTNLDLNTTAKKNLRGLIESSTYF